MEKKVEIENVERLEMMEEKYGVSLDGVYAEYETIGDSRYINVRGEIQAISGTEIEEDLTVAITAYNADGKVIATGKEYLDSDDFYCLSPFDITEEIIEKPTKIRIYPNNS